MISRTEIEDASSTLDSIDIKNMVAIIRTSDRYKADPAYFKLVESKISATSGTVSAQQLNAALTKVDKLGTGQVEINQSQTSGTDGIIYSKKVEREALVDYMLNVLYEEQFDSILSGSGSSNQTLSGNYNVGRLPLDYDGYL